jgi:hypothetical protein
LHTIILAGTSSDPPVALSCNSSYCDIAYTFPIGTVLNGIVEHPLGYDILLYGDSVWYSSQGTDTFYKLVDLASGELAVSLVTSVQHAAYAILTSDDTLYYGRVAVPDLVAIPSPLSLAQGPFVSNILFDALGYLYSFYIDTPGSLANATFPIGLYANSNGELRSYSDSSVLHTTQLLVSGTVSSSDYSSPSSCPLALQTQGTIAVFTQMKSGCTFDSRIENRVLELASGGDVQLLQVNANGTFVVGTITDTLVPLTLSTPLANSSISIYGINDGACGVYVVADYAGFASTDVGRSIIYRLDTIFLTAFTDTMHMNGTSLACTQGFDSELALATSTARDIILNGAGIFTFPDGPTADGTGWYVPVGDWIMYDVSTPQQYRIVAQCSYTALTYSLDGVTSVIPPPIIFLFYLLKILVIFIIFTIVFILLFIIQINYDAAHPAIYLDIGEVNYAYAQVAPSGTNLAVTLSGYNSESVVTSVNSTASFTAANGLAMIESTFAFQEGSVQVRRERERGGREREREREIEKARRRR